MIAAEAITHAIVPGRVVLHDVSFRIDEGEHVVLLGANGSGKSTLLRILAGLVFPTSGRAVFDGTPLERRTLRRDGFERRLRRQVGLSFQSPDAMLFNPTVFDEIAFGPRQLEEHPADLDRRIARWAGRAGVEHLLGRSPFSLSTGEKQRVCLAALLVLEPRLLLLDEPAASLDPRSTGWLVDLLQELDVTTLVSTHNLSMAPELGDRVLVLGEDHRLIHDGAIEPFLADHERLLAANLVHSHRHRHGDREHRHFHIHDWS